MAYYVREIQIDGRKFVLRALLALCTALVLVILFALTNVEAAEQHARRAAKYIGSGNQFNQDGQNWCADFTVFIYGEDLPVPPARVAKKMWNAFRKKGLATNTPRPGDAIFFWRESPFSWKGHVGIVEKVTATEITTIEGNVSGRVTRRTYTRGAIPRLLGFGKV